MTKCCVVINRDILSNQLCYRHSSRIQPYESVEDVLYNDSSMPGTLEINWFPLSSQVDHDGQIERVPSAPALWYAPRVFKKLSTI